MSNCAVDYETTRYQEQVAKSERAALLLEAEARSDIKHNVESVLDDVDHEEYLRAVLVAARETRSYATEADLLELGHLVRALVERAENEAVEAIVQPGLGRIGL